MADSIGGRRRAGITGRAVCEAIEPRQYLSVGFAAPVELTVAGASAPLDEAIFTTGNDNAVDLAVAASDRVQILIGHNDGTFTVGDSIAMPSNPTSEKSFLTGDFGGTGTDDIVLLSRSSGTLNGVSTPESLITYETSNGDGSFTKGSTSLITDHDLGFIPINAAVGDFNGDGDDDLAVLGRPGTGSRLVLAIMTSNGTGSFTETADYNITGSNSSGDLSNELVLSAPLIDYSAGVAIEDKSSGSGNLDIFIRDGSGTLTQINPIHLQANLITAGQSGFEGYRELISAEGNKITTIVGGDGTYGVFKSQTVDGTINALASADFDGDGNMDIVTNLGLQLGNDNGTFQPPIPLPGLGGGAVFANDIIAGDINGDSSPDIVGFSSAGNTIASALNDSGIATSIEVTSSEDPASPGDDVMFTATVTPLSQTGSTPTGTVEFFDGTTELGSASLVNAVATLDAGTGLVAGSHSITAQYSGDSTFNPSTSAAITEGVATPTTITVTSSENPSNFGDDVTFTVTVGSRDADGDIPTGLVYLNEPPYPGDGNLGPIAKAVLDKNGVATFHIASLSSGLNAIFAEYVGDTNYLANSTEFPVIQIVNPSTALNAAIINTTLPVVIVGSTVVHAKAVVSLTNETGSVIAGPAVVTIYAATDGIIMNNMAPSIASLRIPNLRIQPKATIPVIVPINAAPPVGTFTLIAQVSYKSGTTTDSVGGSILTVASPSVSISSVMGAVTPATVKSGGTGSFKLTLTDNGNVNSVGEATIAIGLSSDGATLTAQLTPLRRPLTLKVGKPRTLVLHLKIPKGFESGTYLPIITFTQGTTTFDAVGAVPFDVR